MYITAAILSLASCGSENTEKMEKGNTQVSKQQVSDKDANGWTEIPGSVNIDLIGGERVKIAGIESIGQTGNALLVTGLFTKIDYLTDSDGDIVATPNFYFNTLKTMTFSKNRQGVITHDDDNWFDDRDEYRKGRKVKVFGQDRFTIESNGDLYKKSLKMGSEIKAISEIVSKKTNNLDVFARNKKDQLILKSSANKGKSWGNWVNLGGVLTSDPTAVSLYRNELDVFVRGTDKKLWSRNWNGKIWTDWYSLEGVLKSGPAAVKRNKKIDVVAYGIEGELWRKTYTGFYWKDWEMLGSGPANADTSATPMVGAIGDKLVVLAHRKGSHIYYKVFDNE